MGPFWVVTCVAVLGSTLACIGRDIVKEILYLSPCGESGMMQLGVGHMLFVSSTQPRSVVCSMLPME
jgi:hypothetical protein